MIYGRTLAVKCVLTMDFGILSFKILLVILNSFHPPKNAMDNLYHVWTRECLMG